MRDRVLVKQFKDDAGLAFIEVIRRAGDPVRTQEIKAELIEAGVSKADVDRWWKTLQPSLKEHPRITCPRSGVYEWSFTTESSHDSLEKLTVQAGKRSAGRAWLVEAFTDNISDTLALVEKSGAGAQISWSQQREREKATLLAELVASVDSLIADGGSGADILDWLTQRALDQRLTPLGRSGETVEFDRELHEPAGAARPRPGQAVRVVRAGYAWSGAGPERVVVVKAVVEES
ncbi:hypothetical protein LWF15_28040 [Kineosporia rhizophila]|uniref:hypothetical protein n=1 Tax=Kineosporia rhizophila TaxID=84633 RepID=UPI001E319D9E|nr:hypothetical protein [Kineosporia rhizophila]MCE0539355.1 hypothetical protein [Kineosporia rhizophila]